MKNLTNNTQQELNQQIPKPQEKKPKSLLKSWFEWFTRYGVWMLNPEINSIFYLMNQWDGTSSSTKEREPSIRKILEQPVSEKSTQEEYYVYRSKDQVT